MIRLHHGVIVVALLAVHAASARADTHPTLAECDRGVARAPSVLDSYQCYAEVVHHSGDYEIVLRRLEELRRQRPDDPHPLAVLASIVALRDRRSAASTYSKAAELAVRRNDDTTEILARVGRAGVLMSLRQFAEAEREIEALESRVPARPDARTLTLLARARLAYMREDFGRAVSVLKDLEPLIDGSSPVIRARWLAQKAAVAWATGRTDESIDFYARQVELLHRIGDFYEEATARVNLLVVKNASRRELLRDGLDVLALAKASGNLEAEGRASFFVAQFTDGRDALGYARRSLEIARRLGIDADLTMPLRAVASLTLPFDRAEAFRLIDEAIAIAGRRGDVADVARNRVVRSRMRWFDGPREEAIADSKAALDSIESDRDLQPDTVVRAQRFSAWRAIYCTLAGHLLAGDLLGAGAFPSTSDVALAFETTERMRARVLLDSMDRQQATSALALQPSARSSYAALRSRRFATLDEVGAALKDDEALISYQLSWEASADGTFMGGSWAIVRMRETIRVYRLPPLARIASQLRLYVALLERKDGTDMRASAMLYRELLAGPISELPARIRTLVIVPDDVLSVVPFDTLRSSPDGEPLAAKYDLSLTPSATVWLRWRSGRPLESGRIPGLVLADPDLSSVLRRSGDPASLTPLPRAAREGRAVAADLGERSLVRNGPGASEAWLKHADLTQFAVLHFATHAIVDEGRPDRSALLLAPGATTEDGLLRPREIVTLRLDGQLIVLSACLTASGALVGGDGIMGLSHAFFQAGARAVIGSLWPLADQDAATIMTAFYRHFGQGESAGRALAAARREVMASGAASAAWGDLVLVGDASVALARPASDAAARAGIVALATIAALAAAVVFVLNRARRLS